jgi:hypothetical protein
VSAICPKCGGILCGCAQGERKTSQEQWRVTIKRDWEFDLRRLIDTIRGWLCGR